MREIIGEFEIHFTIAPPGDNNSDQLRDIAERFDMKWLWIELARGDNPSQPMLTATTRGALREIIRQSYDQAEQLTAAGLTVTRIKIEASPHSQGVPSSSDDAAHEPGDRYFEHHIKLLLPAIADLDSVASIASQHGAHLSRNARRRRNDDCCERFITQRCHRMGQTHARAALYALLLDLRNAELQILEHEEEYVVYDSNLELDAGWLP